MRIINTHKRLSNLGAGGRGQIYNGLDCCVTAEVLDVLLPQLDEVTSRTYDFSRSLQGPVLDMRIRGVRVDIERRKQVLDEYADLVDEYEFVLERIVRESTGFYGFNWHSFTHLHKLLYDIYKIPPIRTKEGRRTANRDALEKLEEYKIARVVIRYMEILRDLDKKMDVLSTELDHDERIRTSYNIAGTSTGRFSSSFSEYGTGGNLQNIEESLRSIFIADKGMKLANFDAEQGESRIVGAIEWNLFRKGDYLDTCESGDMHTAVAEMCGLGPEKRQMCKVLGHGTNYGGYPRTMSRHTKIPAHVITDFQERYFGLFPAHHMWHAWVATQIKSYGHLTSLMGRKRWFFGRRDDDKTIRDAIAYDPQGSLADIVNAGMLRVWHARDCQLLLQVHDAIVVQYPEDMEDDVIPKLQAQLYHEIPLKHGRMFTIPYGCQTGWNWGKHSEGNPDGLKTYKPGDKRTRQAGA